MANADLAEPRVFLRKAFSHTVAAALIYCIGSLPNGAAGEERRAEGEDEDKDEDKDGRGRTQKRIVKVIGTEK